MGEMKNPLRKAIRFLRDHEWVKGASYTGTRYAPTGVCSIGAIYLANEGNEEAQLEATRLLSLAMAEHGFAGISIPRWNDYEAHNVDQVIHMFKFAAERWDELHAKQPTP